MVRAGMGRGGGDGAAEPAPPELLVDRTVELTAKGDERVRGRHEALEGHAAPARQAPRRVEAEVFEGVEIDRGVPAGDVVGDGEGEIDRPVVERGAERERVERAGHEPRVRRSFRERGGEGAGVEARGPMGLSPRAHLE